MKVNISGMILVTAMFGLLGTACLTRTEGPSQQPEPEVRLEVKPYGYVKPLSPAASTNPPITILDTIDPDKCSFIHNINACFSDGQPPADIPLGDYMDVYFKAVQDLNDRTGEDRFGAKMKSVERVDWNDASLGNPEPGMGYIQVITPGFKLVLESEGEFHTYHTGLNRVVFVESN